MFLFIIIYAVTIKLTSGAESLENLQNRQSSSPTIDACPDACYTQDCLKEEVDYLLNYMNLSVDPCDNFYQYACGKFVSTAEIPYHGLLHKHERIEAEIIDEIVPLLKFVDESNKFSAPVKVKNFYRNCLHTFRGKINGKEVVLDLLESIGGWPILVGTEWNEKSFDLANSLKILLNKKFISEFPIKLVKTEDHFFIDKFPTTLEYDNPEDSRSDIFLDYIKDVSRELGAKNPSNATFISQQIFDIFEFEKNWVDASIAYKEIKKLQDEFTYESSIKNLTRDYSSIPWFEILNNIFNEINFPIDENQNVTIKNINYIHALDKILKNSSPRKVANYLGWTIVRSSMQYMDRKLKKLLTDFAKNYYNDSINIPSWSDHLTICKEYVQYHFGVALSSMYIKRYINQTIVDDTYRIFTDVRNQISKDIQEVEGIDDRLRDVISFYLSEITTDVKSSFNNWNEEKVNNYYEMLEIHPGNFYDSVRNVSFHNWFKESEILLFKDSNELRSIFPVSVVYQWSENDIGMTLSALHRPVYKKNRLPFFNYAGLGTLFGHEIAHAFGRNVTLFTDENENDIKFWDNRTKQTECLIHQYDTYSSQEGNFTIDGNRTLNENLSNEIGFAAAYFAYKKFLERNPMIERCMLKSAMQFTWQQMYWLNLANNHCAKYSPQFLRDKVLNDVHSPAEASINIPLANSEDFARDFNCKLNSRMNPEKKCKVF